jgi:hypothetical protein
MKMLLSSLSEMGDSKKWVAALVGVLSVVAADKGWLTASAAEHIVTLVMVAIGAQAAVDTAKAVKGGRAS